MTPDFASLFAVCSCRRSSCERCEGWQLSPRTARALWSSAQLLADLAYDDVQQHGDEPVRDPDGWSLFADYPRLTWRQNAAWRRHAARAYDDLADDLAAGRWPVPRCFGEEMALHLLLGHAAELVADDPDGLVVEDIAGLPRHHDDFDWDMTGEMLFEDHDILTLNDPSLDGIEDPDSEHNRRYGIGDMRPAAWFEPFANVEPRDGRRGFRR